MQVLSIADFFHNNKNDPLCVKALQRRAEAYRALQQTSRAVEDLQVRAPPQNQLAPARVWMCAWRCVCVKARNCWGASRPQTKTTHLALHAAPLPSPLPSCFAASLCCLTHPYLQAALDMDPKNGEVAKQLARARLEDVEARKQRAVAKAVAKNAAAGEAGGGSGTVEAAGLALDLGKLGRVEKLAAALATPPPLVVAAPPAPASAEDQAASASSNGSSNGVAQAAGAGEATARRGPALPPRPVGKGSAAAAAAAPSSGAAAAASTSGSGSVGVGGGSVAVTCEELRGLLNGDDGCCVYLRECGGLQSLATRVSHGIAGWALCARGDAFMLSTAMGGSAISC